ncbi:HAD family hydrolase [Halorhabdus salina]|uniref:HAD family hydrolase n=1 Tax=Halorhabdus salina TaxID=2750670 RepID=UPI0015EEDDE0|nr:HAD-IA family hydrolase [Halorhabdus salina]
MTQSPTYDFWLFDLDGTLVDVDAAYPRQIFDQVGKRLGYEFSDRQVRILWHGLAGARNPKLRDWGIDPDEFWAIYHEVEDAQARAGAAYSYDDARRLLGAIDGPIGIVTHSQPYLANATLERVGLQTEIDALVCCNEQLGWKPDPAPVERAMADLGVDGNGHAGVMVGDSPQDIRAAHNAGLDGIHIERFDEADRPDDIDGEYHVEALDELV